MKCKIPEISWHNRDPVLSVDIQPSQDPGGCGPDGQDGQRNSAGQEFYRLATGGSDCHVVIWHVVKSDGEGSESGAGDIELELAADLKRHQRAVNVVKWSPNGDLLASGDDESFVIIWKQRRTDLEQSLAPPPLFDDNVRSDEQFKETWLILKVLRGHLEDIYDLSWSPNGNFLVTGSVDNTAIVWDLKKGKQVSILSDHKGFVLGVAWDPLDKFIATLSTDRYLRTFDIQSKKILTRTQKGLLPLPENHPLYGKRVRFYHDDTLQTFFRRLTFSADGRLLITPCGIMDYENGKYQHSTYVFSRNNLTKPIFVLPCPDQYSVAVACSPNLYRLRPYDPEKNPPAIPLPYRMILAVATRSSVFFYDTQQKVPFGVISNIHYTRLTDITWSSDGQLVVVSSTDGFCSLISFAPNELGEIYQVDTEEEEEEEESVGTIDQQDVNGIDQNHLEEMENDVEMLEMEKHLPINENKQTAPIKEQMKMKIKKKEGVQIEKPKEVKEKTLNHQEIKMEIKRKRSDVVDKKTTPIPYPELPVNPSVESKMESKVSISGHDGNRKDSSDDDVNDASEKKVVRKYAISAIGSLIRGSGNKPLPSRFGNQPAKPIAFRRAPRTNNNNNNNGRRGTGSTSAERVTTNVATLMEEALDAWPSSVSNQLLLQSECAEGTSKESKDIKDSKDTRDSKDTKDTKPLREKRAGTVVASSNEVNVQNTSFEHTEDICLVYEDDTGEITNTEKSSTK